MTSPQLQSYRDAIDYLYGYINWEVSRHMRYSPEVMTLDRPRRVLALLGNPQESYPIIHITGTKGKGSVGAMCAASLQASGLNTGLYSSPHLQDFRERFRFNNELISETEFVELINRLRPAIEQVEDITWFEVTTALAFLFFAERGADAAVIEVGLGGRLDATNVVTPVVSVITSLSYDHMHLLGDSLASIAREKAGIIKPGVPVVSAPQPPEALDVLVEVAAQNESTLTLVGRDWLFDRTHMTDAGECFQAGIADHPLDSYCVSLHGEHQALNATVALAALNHAQAAGVPITVEGMRQGLLAVDWPGRFEIVRQDPTIILDAAHNGASARRLRATLTSFFPDREIVLIFGASADKDVLGMFEALLPITAHLIAAQAVHPRALAPDEIEALAREQGYSGSVTQIASAAGALKHAMTLTGDGGLICTTGSLFIVGELRTELGLPAGHTVRRRPVLSAPSCGD